MKKIGVVIFVLLLLAAGGYYFFLNYPATTYAILGLNYSGNSNTTQTNASAILNSTPVNSTNSSSSLTPITGSAINSGNNVSTTNNQENNTPTTNVSVTNETTPVTDNTSSTSNVSITTPSTSTTYNISIVNFAFSTAVLTIHQGDSVLWINQDGMSHHVISLDSSDEIDSSTLYPGYSYSHTFLNKGTFDYHCAFYPSLNGTIIVE
jgi:plastocyanin